MFQRQLPTKTHRLNNQPWELGSISAVYRDILNNKNFANVDVICFKFEFDYISLVHKLATV